MIRINLKKTKTSISRFSRVTAAGTEGAEETGLSALKTQLSSIDLSQLPTDILLKIVIKLAIVCSFPLGFKIYEITNLQKLEKIMDAENAVLKQKEAEIAAVESKIKNFSHLQAEEDEFNKKKELLSDLAASRLIIPSFLDEIQTIIPDFVYLTSIVVSPEQQGQRNVAIAGEAVSDESINKFADELKNIVDSDSLKLNSNDTGKERIRFNITSKMQSD